jgi:hypothetical protein
MMTYQDASEIARLFRKRMKTKLLNSMSLWKCSMLNTLLCLLLLVALLHAAIISVQLTYTTSEHNSPPTKLLKIDSTPDPDLDAYWAESYSDFNEVVEPPHAAFLIDLANELHWIQNSNDNNASSSFPPRPHSKGIIIPAGGKKYLSLAAITIHIIRHHLHSPLPITITYWGNEPSDVPDPHIKQFILDTFDVVEFLDLSSTMVTYPSSRHRPLFNGGGFNGFKTKVFSLWASPYKQALLLDADSIPLLNPQELFSLPEYTTTGSLLFPDYTCTEVPLFPSLALAVDGFTNPWRQKCNYKVRQAESGQLLIDLRRHSDVIDLALFINIHDEYSYVYAYGDKDIYRAAFILAGKAHLYTQVALPPSVPVEMVSSTKLRSKGFVQHHPRGHPAFLHMIGDSKFNPLSSSPSSSRLHIDALIRHPACSFNQNRWKAVASIEGSTLPIQDVAFIDIKEECGGNIPIDMCILSSSTGYDGIWNGEGEKPPAYILTDESSLKKVEMAVNQAIELLQSSLVSILQTEQKTPL